MNVSEEWSTSGGESVSADLHSHLAAATPALLELGGTRRVLAVLPRGGETTGDASPISTSLGSGVNSIRGVDNGVTLCVEAAGLPIEDVAIELVQRRRDRIEFAARVQSRTDIDWTPIVRLTTPAASADCSAHLAQPSVFDEPLLEKTMVM